MQVIFGHPKTQIDCAKVHHSIFTLLMLSQLLQVQPKSIEGNLVYNYSEDSDSSKFYDKLF